MKYQFLLINTIKIYNVSVNAYKNNFLRIMFDKLILYLILFLMSQYYFKGRSLLKQCMLFIGFNQQKYTFFPQNLQKKRNINPSQSFIFLHFLKFCSIGGLVGVESFGMRQLEGKHGLHSFFSLSYIFEHKAFLNLRNVFFFL